MYYIGIYLISDTLLRNSLIISSNSPIYLIVKSSSHQKSRLICHRFDLSQYDTPTDISPISRRYRYSSFGDVSKGAYFVTYHLYAYTCKLSWYVGTTISTSHPNVPTYQHTIHRYKY